MTLYRNNDIINNIKYSLLFIINERENNLSIFYFIGFFIWYYNISITIIFNTEYIINIQFVISKVVNIKNYYIIEFYIQ